MKAALTAIALLTCLSACKRRPPPDQLVEDGWSEVRAELLNGTHCFAEDPAYCITEASYVDSAIKRRLEDLYGGEMPLRRAHVEATKRAAAIAYKKLQLAPAGLALIEATIEERYLEPTIKVSEQSVSVDFGVVPGKLSGHGGSLVITMDSSELAPGGEWLESEARRALVRYAQKHPDTALLRIKVKVPTSTGLGSYDYHYQRSKRRLVVVEPSQRLRFTPVQTDAQLATIPLNLSDLTVCAAKPTDSRVPTCEADIGL